MAQTTLRIMPLGDSNTEGYPQMEGGYRVQLWNRLYAEGFTVDMVGSMIDAFEWAQPRHEGHSGWTINDLDTHIVDWLNTSNPDIVLLMIGTNDILTGQHDLMRSRMEALIDKIYATKSNVRLIVAKLLPIWGEPANTQVRLFNTTLTSIVGARASQGRRITLVDMNTPFDANDLIDGVHPTGEAAAKMGDIWADAVSKLLHDPYQQLSPVLNQLYQQPLVEFVWTQGASEESYKIRLKSLDGMYRFGKNDISSSSCIDGICRTKIDFSTTPFPFEASLKWRVVGNTLKTSWQPFLIKIPAPELIFPEIDAQLQTVTPDFTWSLVPNATQYTLQVDLIDLAEKVRLVKFSFNVESNPSIVDVCNPVSNTCSVSLSVLNISLPSDGTYRWRVKTVGAYGKTSSTRSTFTVASSSDLIPLP
jgi:acyl-CoA thioesterase I